MNRFKYNNIAEYSAAMKKKKKSIIHGQILSVVIVCLVISAWVGGRQTTPAPVAVKSVLVEGARSGIPSDSRVDDVLWHSWIDAANVAAAKWTAVGLNVGPYKLVADPDGCGPDAIACADKKSMTVYVCQDRRSVDKITIMMHEIGHLLGVPHIEGDPLMSAAYQNNVLDAPSKAAIAVADSQLTVIWNAPLQGKK